MIVFGKIEYAQVLERVDIGVNQGMELGANIVANNMMVDVREQLDKKIAAYASKTTRPPRKHAIQQEMRVMKAAGSKNLARYDVVIGSRAIPYLFWVEFGSEAPFGLPYSKAGGRDFRNSRFKGHRFIRTVVERYKRDNKLTSVPVSAAIELSVRNMLK